jgi:hypothetical protein
VCDTDADLEGEEEGGSADVEERNLMARTVAARADVCFVVGLGTMKGVHALVRVVGELLDHDVPAGLVVPVVNVAPKSARARAEVAAAIASLLDSRVDARSLPSPVFLPERRVDDALRDGVRLPASLATPLAGAFTAVLERSAGAGVRAPEPQLVKPGSLGHWSPEPA